MQTGEHGFFGCGAAGAGAGAGAGATTGAAVPGLEVMQVGSFG